MKKRTRSIRAASGSLRWHESQWRKAIDDAQDEDGRKHLAKELGRLSYSLVGVIDKLRELEEFIGDLYEKEEHSHRTARQALDALMIINHQSKTQQNAVFSWPKKPNGDGKPN